ncbi:MAG: leucyl aminopeptidase [Halothiobacillaceae bacterium]|nr:MAG: leucyl aminopeptidase [Halothiobacillaceae bacterium]
MKINVKQSSQPLTAADVEGVESLIYLTSPTLSTELSAKIPYGSLIKQRLARQGPSQSGDESFATHLPNTVGTHTLWVTLKKDPSSFELLTLARKWSATQLKANPKQITLAIIDLDGALALRAVEALLAALLAAVHPLPSFKNRKIAAKQLTTLRVYGLEKKLTLQRTFAEAEGNNLARYLTALPPNELTPGNYRKEIQRLAKQYGWQMDFIDMKALQQKQAGAFLAVAQGSANRDAGIVHLRYEPTARKAKQAKRLALVGKGICFDTGGTNLKSAKSMHGMHEDMEGSAVALGTLVALTELKINHPVDCWLAISENQIGPAAYRQNEVVKASNGVTIEIVHTDAEGRLVLADTLSFAALTLPDLIIDYATLTGACVAALSSRYCGIFTNRMALLDTIIQAGRDSGERVWPFPNDDDFDDELESQIADIKQCTLGNDADHILATRFLNRFVANIPWLHIDLSAGNHKGGLAHIPTDITGFGVRFTLELLLSQAIMKKL